MAIKHETEEDRWAYNCSDAVYTRECGEVEIEALAKLGLTKVDEFQQRLLYPVLEAMNRGVLVSIETKSAFAMELQEEMMKREQWFQDVLGHEFNPRSPLQMTSLFYEDLGQQKIFTRAKKGVAGHLTCDDKALETLRSREPLLIPLIKNIQEYRSLGVFLSTFVLARLDEDYRMRCSYNLCGTETFRFSSSKNPFDRGTNLQNIPKGDDHDDPNRLSLPNVRKLFIPDPGFTFFDMDLDRADLQVVVWEAGDGELKSILREGVDMHTENAKLLGISRQMAKVWVHGTNYGGGPRTMAIHCGITVHQAERMRTRWFEAHPGIRAWHGRTESQLSSKRYVENRFGYRRHYFDRIEGLLPEALAWIPQSTVACVINRVWMNLYDFLKPVWVLLQVHDSLAGEFPTHRKAELLPKMKELSRITIPYDDPLVIPTGIKTSEKSWGDCL